MGVLREGSLALDRSNHELVGCAEGFEVRAAGHVESVWKHRSRSGQFPAVMISAAGRATRRGGRASTEAPVQ